MRQIRHSGPTSLLDAHRPIVLGIAGGRVEFIAAADRLLLENPANLACYLRRLSA